ncbi:Structural maintenance of chromosomes protein 6 [Phlyctochytrium bullatum]|nr:Structural maintenance of chromosomes protein 6 [Phlyctochytrium bullatum]
MAEVKEQSLWAMKKEVEKLKQQYKEVADRTVNESDLDELQNRLAWALIKQAEQEQNKLERDLASKLQALDTQEKHINTIMTKITELKGEHSDLKAKLSQVSERQANLTERRQGLMAERREVIDRNTIASGDKKGVKRGIENSKINLQALKDRLEHELKVSTSRSRTYREGLQKKIDKLRSDLAQKQQELTQVAKMLIEADTVFRDSQYRKGELSEKVDAALIERNRKRDELAKLEADRDSRDPFASFHRDTAIILQQIERYGRWSGIKPVGPIVTSSSDVKPMFDIFRNHVTGRHPPIMIFKGPKFDYSSEQPHEDYITVLRCLEITDPYILRALILQKKIEQTVLVENRHDGERIAENGFSGRKICAVYTKDYCRIGGNRGGLQIEARKLYRGKPRIQTDSTQYIAQAKEENRAAEREYRELLNELKGVEDGLTEMKANVEQLRDMEASLKADIDTLKRRIESLEEDLKEDRPSQMKSLEEMIKHEEENLVSLQSQLADVDKIIKDCSNSEHRLNADIKENENESKLLDRESKKLEKSLEPVENRIVDDEQNYRSYLKKKDSFQLAAQELTKKVEDTSERLRSDIEKALKMNGGERLDENEDPEVLARSIKEIQTKLKERVKHVVSKEAILKKLDAKLSDYIRANEYFDRLKEALDLLSSSLEERKRKWRKIRRDYSVRVKNKFTFLMKDRGYHAQLNLDHDKKTLTIRVDVNKNEIFEDLQQGRGKDGPSIAKDPKTLSGGERSFTTVCLLLSVWFSIASPFRALDEFDVFMDAVNRGKSMELMLDYARTEERSRQYIFITPQNMGHVVALSGPDVRIIRLGDPERNQSTLDFSGAGRSE